VVSYLTRSFGVVVRRLSAIFCRRNYFIQSPGWVVPAARGKILSVSFVPEAEVNPGVLNDRYGES